MAKLNRKEFAAFCRTTGDIVRVNISRGKIKEIIRAGKSTIDTEDPINQKFYKRYNAGPVPKEQKKTTKKTRKPPNETTEPSKGPKKSLEKTINSADFETEDWDTRKTIADALLQEAKAEKERMAVEKLAGKLLPVELIFTIVQIHNRTIFTTFQNDLDNFASVYCDILAGGDRKKLSEISGKLAQKLADTIQRAADVAQSSVENAIDDYQETRNRGERK